MVRGYCSDSADRTGGVRRVRKQALRPFVKYIIGGHRVTLESQHQTQPFAEPLQSLITVGSDRRRYNMMLVNLVEAVAHQTKLDLTEGSRLYCDSSRRFH